MVARPAEAPNLVRAEQRGARWSAIAHTATTTLLTIHACLPTWRPCVNPYCSKQLERRAEEEASLRSAACSDLGNGFNETAARAGDQVERALERRTCDALATMPLVDEYAVTSSWCKHRHFTGPVIA